MTQIARALDRTQFIPHVGCFIPGGVRDRELRFAGVPIVQFPVTSFRNLSPFTSARMFRRYIQEHQISLVHAFDTPSNVFTALWARTTRVTKLVTSQRAHRDLVSPGYRRLLRISDRRAHSIVVNCEFLRHHLIDDERAPADRIHLCYNGVDLEEFQPGPRKRPAALTGDGLVIGVICALRPEKGLDTLLTAFANLSRSVESLRLAVVGHGPSLESLRALAHRLGVESRVHFEPGTARVIDWLHAFDIFVLPSLSEAFSNALMEAMACRCAVVASRVGGNPELVAEDRGRLFASGDPQDLERTVRQLIEQPDLRARLACAGAEFVQRNLSLTASARRMEEIYRLTLYP
jgi:L-malate glycosyltransferase